MSWVTLARNRITILRSSIDRSKSWPVASMASVRFNFRLPTNIVGGGFVFRGQVPASHLVSSTNVCEQSAMHLLSLSHALQMDFLEHESVNDVIIMGVVLEEVRHRNSSIYQRLRALTASPTKRFFVFGNEHHRSFCSACLSASFASLNFCLCNAIPSRLQVCLGNCMTIYAQLLKQTCTDVQSLPHSFLPQSLHVRTTVYQKLWLCNDTYCDGVSVVRQGNICESSTRRISE